MRNRSRQISAVTALIGRFPELWFTAAHHAPLVDDRIATFVRSPRFARVAALLGVDRVRLYHDQALCKEPGGGVPLGTRTSTTGPSTPTRPSRCGCPWSMFSPRSGR